MKARVALSILWVAGCLAPAPFPSPSKSEVREVFVFRTEMGEVAILPYPEVAPRTVERIASWIASGYYDGRSFTRVVPGHVIQVTDVGGLGVTEDPRTIPLEVSPEAFFSAGAAGIARGESKDSGGSEFFLMDYATSHLHMNYTVFGQVIRGLDVVHAIARVPAVESRSIPLPFETPLPDRMAIRPVRILEAHVQEEEIPLSLLQSLPRVVAPNVRVGDYRYSLEWSRTLQGGVEGDLTVYIRPYNGSNEPDTRGWSMRVEERGTLIPLRPEELYAGILQGRLTPPTNGPLHFTLLDRWGAPQASFEWKAHPPSPLLPKT